MGSFSVWHLDRWKDGKKEEIKEGGEKTSSR
jgi:hypothetical protein